MVRVVLRLLAALPWLLVLGGDAFAIKRSPAREAADHPAVVIVNTSAAKTRKACAHSGVLIAPTVVLTAAHCVRGFDIFEVTAPYAKGRPLRAVTRTVHIHPAFEPGKIEDDLALLVLDEPLDVGAALPVFHTGNLFPIETPLQVVGRVKNGTIAATQLFEAPITLVGFPGNSNLYGGHPQTVEKGDSGGPIFLAGKDAKVVGIVSGILEFNRGNVPTDAYVPLSRKNRDWIHQHLPRKP